MSKQPSTPASGSRRSGSPPVRLSVAKQRAVPAADGCPSCNGRGCLEVELHGCVLTVACNCREGTRGGNTQAHLRSEAELGAAPGSLSEQQPTE